MKNKCFYLFFLWRLPLPFLLHYQPESVIHAPLSLSLSASTSPKAKLGELRLEILSPLSSSSISCKRELAPNGESNLS